ncbi:hypothetical protein D3C81_2222440 [compost metagenome]
MVSWPKAANTREGLCMPSLALNQLMVDSPAPVMALFTLPRALVMPLARPCRIMRPKSVNLAGSSTPR